MKDPRLEAYLDQVGAEARELRLWAARLRVSLSELVAFLRRERHGSRTIERARELGKDRQVGAEPYPLDASHAKRS